MNIKYKYVRMIVVRAFGEDQYAESICKKERDTWQHQNNSNSFP